MTTSQTQSPRAAAPAPAPSAAPTSEAGASGGAGALQGMGYAAQRQAVAPSASGLNPAAAPPGADPGSEVSATDVPGVLYSNTSKTNLNKSADWVARLGFSLGTAYKASVTLDELILAGRAIRAPRAAAVGAVKVPAGAGMADPREYDYIHTPTGSVTEKGTNRFAMRGGQGGAGAPVELSFANNGALNLARLARSAYELAVEKGVTFVGDRIDYHGQTFALSCAVQMGNAVEAEGARAYGFVGEFDLKWIREKVSTTVQSICATTVVAVGKGMKKGEGDGGLMHPNHEASISLRTPRREQVQGKSGQVTSLKTGVAPIESNRFGNATVRSWGEGDDQMAWLVDPATLAARAQRRLQGAWAPGADWHGHPTYITQCPDFTALLTTCFEACSGTDKGVDQMAPLMLDAVRKIGATLQTAPMNHALIDDPEHLARLEIANKGVIAAAFAEVQLAKIVTELQGLAHAKLKPVDQGSEKPVKGERPNDEGLVVLRDWSSRDR